MSVHYINVVYAFLIAYESHTYTYILALSDLTASQADVMIHTDLAIHHNDTSAMLSNCSTAEPCCFHTASPQPTESVCVCVCVCERERERKRERKETELQNQLLLALLHMQYAV